MYLFQYSQEQTGVLWSKHHTGLHCSYLSLKEYIAYYYSELCILVRKGNNFRLKVKG